MSQIISTGTIFYTFYFSISSTYYIISIIVSGTLSVRRSCNFGGSGRTIFIVQDQCAVGILHCLIDIIRIGIITPCYRCGIGGCIGPGKICITGTKKIGLVKSFSTLRNTQFEETWRCITGYGYSVVELVVAFGCRLLRLIDDGTCYQSCCVLVLRFQKWFVYRCSNRKCDDCR